jgi:predicted AlkP superfamily phosphohydrolase/phosphomutase
LDNCLLIIGIDALDTRTIIQLRDELPNFNALLQSSSGIQFDGVFPPDSPTSWASIYTGLNPARHGILLFVDPLSKASTMVNKDVDDSNIRGKTFWDIAGSMGKKVCIIPHLLGYPVWPVNGIMIGRSGVNGDVDTFPEDIRAEYAVSDFKWDLDLFPGKRKSAFIGKVKDQIRREVEFSQKIYKKNAWDVFFVSFGELDMIQYSLWNYFDKEDPGYVENNPYEGVIPEFYKLFDSIVGQFQALADENTVTIVVSDHGIGSRPVHLLNVNEVLRRKGLIRLKQGSQPGKVTPPLSIKLKKAFLNLIDRHDLSNLAAALLRIYPGGKEWFVSSGHVDWEKSEAYLVDQSGIKNYPYGGIQVKKTTDSRYEELTDLVVNEIKNITDERTGDRIVNWICKREALYSGDFNSMYPSICFEFNEKYGAGNVIPAELFGKSSTHNIAPGCHKQHHATFLISEVNGRNVVRKSMNLMDVSPTILDLLGINQVNFDFDGRSIFE